jgi:hypothetical protein
MGQASFLRATIMTSLLLLSSCFGPDAMRMEGSCAAGSFTLFGKWKLTRGYPINFKYGPTPTPEELIYDFRVLIIEPGDNMCMSDVVNRGMKDPPLYRRKYTHNISEKKLEMDMFWQDGQNVRPWLRESATYTVTGCGGDKPVLTVTYSNGREEVYSVYSRQVRGGDCKNPTNPVQ